MREQKINLYEVCVDDLLDLEKIGYFLAKFEDLIDEITEIIRDDVCYNNLCEEHSMDEYAASVEMDFDSIAMMLIKVAKCYQKSIDANQFLVNENRSLRKEIKELNELLKETGE